MSGQPAGYAGVPSQRYWPRIGLASSGPLAGRAGGVNVTDTRPASARASEPASGGPPSVDGMPDSKLDASPPVMPASGATLDELPHATTATHGATRTRHARTWRLMPTA